MKSKITPDVVRAALRHLSPNVSRDEWFKVLAAIKSEFPEDVGFALAEEWSAQGTNYSAASFRSTWKSAQASGGVTIGTLLHLAQEEGFDLPKGDDDTAPTNPAVTARLARERADKQREDQEALKVKHTRVAGEAEAMWQEASETGYSEYLDRKAVKAHGVRFTSSGLVLVPMRDESNKLWNLQRISATPFGNTGTNKLFLKDGLVPGNWHWIGTPEGTPVLLVAEGYATAASIHEATGRPIAVAFTAGNLLAVAKAVRKAFPSAHIVMAGDDDMHTCALTGKNTGRDKATAAAKAVKGLAVFPEGLPESGKDFNDLALASGLEAVRLIVDGAIDTNDWSETSANGKPHRSSKKDPKKENAESATLTRRDSQSDVYDPFYVDDHGVWHEGYDNKGKPLEPNRICGRLDVTAMTRDTNDYNWGYLLSWRNRLGVVKQWALPSRMLSGDGGEYRSILLDRGLDIQTTPRARGLLTEYIQSRAPEQYAISTDTIGWDASSRAFVLPNETIGKPDEKVIFQTDRAIENTFATKGSLEQWKKRVGSFCVGNSRLVFAVSTALAGPLLKPSGMESGGFHFVGDSSSGKTTSLNVTASVFGGKGFKRTWKGTGVGFEVVAAASCDTTLLLDELKECDPKVAADVIYMLGNGQGKMRGNTGIQMRPMTRWRLLFISTGEITLEQHLSSANSKINEGQKTRLANIPADAGKGLGVFEDLHGLPGGADLSKLLSDESALVYGTVGRAWLEYLTANTDSLRQDVKDRAAKIAKSLIPTDAGGQVERVGSRFALIAAAGELATEQGLTGWPRGESENAARVCFEAWLKFRGGTGNGEVPAMLRQVRHFLETHGDSRFANWHRKADDSHAPKIQYRAGARKIVSTGMDTTEEPIFEYYILIESFKKDVCGSFDHLAVCRALLAHGCLKPDADRAYDCKPRVPGISDFTRCYRILPKIFDLDI